MRITMDVTVKAPLEMVWEAWTNPSIIQQWNASSREWYCPVANIDLHVNGRFHYRLEHQDEVESYHFDGVFTRLKLLRLIEYTLDDGRQVSIRFEELPDGIKIIETFDVDPTRSAEQQRSNWQSILSYFKKVVETNYLLS